MKVGDLDAMYINQTEERISEKGLEYSSAKVLPTNTILIAMYCNDAIGKTSIISTPMATNQAICGLYPNKALYTEYSFYTILASKTKLQEKSAGGAQKNINQRIINELFIPIPPLGEQQRIVTAITQVFQFIEG